MYPGYIYKQETEKSIIKSIIKSNFKAFSRMY